MTGDLGKRRDADKVGKPLRNFASPHNAMYVGQPAHMREFVRTKSDNGGVHINLGLLNRARKQCLEGLLSLELSLKNSRNSAILSATLPQTRELTIWA